MRHLIWIPVLLATFAFLARANAADTNMGTMCSPNGVNCVSDCKNYTAQYQDDPCWLITSCDSDWEKPWLSWGVKDFRGHC